MHLISHPKSLLLNFIGSTHFTIQIRLRKIPIKKTKSCLYQILCSVFLTVIYLSWLFCPKLNWFINWDTWLDSWYPISSLFITALLNHFLFLYVMFLLSNIAKRRIVFNLFVGLYSRISRWLKCYILSHDLIYWILYITSFSTLWIYRMPLPHYPEIGHTSPHSNY